MSENKNLKPNKIENTFGTKKFEVPINNEKRNEIIVEKKTEQYDKKSETNRYLDHLNSGGIAGTLNYINKEEERKKKVEKILEANLSEIYLNLNPKQQIDFKRSGEKCAVEINNLLNQIKLNAEKIVKVIKKWLSLIPGINKFFLEQEAKIKTDEILKIKRNE